MCLLQAWTQGQRQGSVTLVTLTSWKPHPTQGVRFTEGTKLFIFQCFLSIYIQWKSIENYSTSNMLFSFLTGIVDSNEEDKDLFYNELIMNLDQWCKHFS